MNKIVYDTDMIKTIALFEKITRARIKDSFTFKDAMAFVVYPNNLAKALGKNKVNVTKLEKLLKKRIKIIEYSDDKLRFIKNLMAPLKILEIEEDDEGVVTIKGPDAKTKGLMIGARAQNLRLYEEVTRKYFDCKEIKVV